MSFVQCCTWVSGIGAGVGLLSGIFACLLFVYIAVFLFFFLTSLFCDFYLINFFYLLYSLLIVAFIVDEFWLYLCFGDNSQNLFSHWGEYTRIERFGVMIVFVICYFISLEVRVDSSPLGSCYHYLYQCIILFLCFYCTVLCKVSFIHTAGLYIANFTIFILLEDMSSLGSFFTVVHRAIFASHTVQFLPRVQRGNTPIDFMSLNQYRLFLCYYFNKEFCIRVRGLVLFYSHALYKY